MQIGGQVGRQMIDDKQVDMQMINDGSMNRQTDRYVDETVPFYSYSECYMKYEIMNFNW